MATKYYVQNFGCRATQADAALIECRLGSRGYSRSERRAMADVVVLNTCTVTAAADQEAHKAIREIHRNNPQTRIIVTGCYAQRAPEEIAALPGVTWVVGNAHQGEIAGLPERRSGGASGGLGQEPGTRAVSTAEGFFPAAQLKNVSEFPVAGTATIVTSEVSGLTSLPFGQSEMANGERTRPILKIQDGCDHHCAYCIIPSVRGRSRSVPAKQVVDRVGALAAAGYREIVLSGINLGSYGQDLSPRANLRGLLARLLDETPVEQLRLSSIEPVDVTQDLIDTFARTNRLAPHFHMPLQSGSDTILRAMHRWYRAEQYARRMEYLHDAMPDAAIGADVIAGFPGETEDDHQATMEMIESLPFTYLHVFSYSARPGTQAAEMSVHVPPQMIHRRAKELRALSGEKRRKFTLAQAGKVVRVLTLETTGEGWREAISGNYQRVRVAGNWLRNTWLMARPAADGSLSSVIGSAAASNGLS